METTPSPRPSPSSDPLAALAALPGVPEAVDAVRSAVDGVYGHRVMRRRSAEVSAEAALRGARASAALSGADWALEEVRRRSDFGSGEEPRTVGAALRLTAEAGELLDIWRGSPLRVLARLHLVAAGGTAPDETVGRPRRAGEPVREPGPVPAVPPEPSGGTGEAGMAGMAGMVGDEAGGTGESGETGDNGRAGEPGGTGVPLPAAEEMSARLEQLAGLLSHGSRAPALITAAVVHGELLALRPFRSHNGLVARAAGRIVLVSSGLDPKSVAPSEAGHAEQGSDAYRAALSGYASGTPEGVAAWIAHCGRAVELGARESTAVCEALQRGAA